MKSIRKILLALMVTFTITSCARHTYTEEPHEDTHIEEIQPINLGVEQSLNDEEEPSILNVDLDEEIIEEDLPQDVSKAIAKRAYSLVILDLMTLGYEVYTGSLGGVGYGFVYSDYSDIYRETVTNHYGEEDFNYVGCGFINLKINQDESHILYEPSYCLLKTYNMENIGNNFINKMLDNHRVEGIKGHFVDDGKYVKYELKGDTLQIRTYEKGNYDKSLGTIYDYENDDYIYIPLDQIPDAPTSFEYLVQPIDAEKIKATFNQMHEEQTSLGFEKHTIATVFISTKMFELLNGSLSQQPKLNGILLSTLQNIQFDHSKQYLSMRDDGTIAVMDIPPLPKEKTVEDWIMDALVIAGGLTIAITLTVCTGGLGTAIGAGIFGAVTEYATETLILGKSFDEVNWGKVLIGAVTGALTAGVPVANTLGQFVARSIGVGVIEAAGSIASSLIDGMTDYKQIIKIAVGQAALGMALYSLRNVVAAVKKPDVVSVKANTTNPEISKMSKNIIVVDDQPVLLKARQTFEKLSLNNVVSSGYSSALSSGSGEFMEAAVETTTKIKTTKLISESFESLYERFF